MRSRVHVLVFSPLLLAATLCLAPLPAQVSFVNVAPQTGTTNPSFGRGAGMVDLDGDGLLDLIASNAGMQNGVFRQLPDHAFQDAYALWGLAPDNRAHWGVLVADFDNDGDPDLYFLNGGFTASQANQILRNDLGSTGTFTDVSAASGDGDLEGSTFGGTALDYDRDGMLDIFLSNNGTEGCNLLRNLGGLVFANVSNAAGISQSGDSHRHCSSGDMDNDGWIDVAVGTSNGPNLLYRNNGNGTFTDIAASAGVVAPGDNFGLVLEDFDNDGWMDLYLPIYQAEPTGPSRLFLNHKDQTFTDVTAGSGMTGQTDMGHNTGDVDGDGYPDVFIGTGSPTNVYPDVLFLIAPNGSGGLVATDVSASSGILSEGPTRCHGSAFGDYDADGDVDMYLNNGGPEKAPSMLEPNFFWQKQGNANAWLELRLQGVLSNRSAAGARAVARTSSGREVHRQLTVGKGFGNTDSPVLHFGLGAETAVTRLVVSWPSGITQTRLSPPAFTVQSMVETGLRIQGNAAPGSTITLESAGKPGFRSEIFASATTQSVPLPKYGGILELGLPLFPVASLVLDAGGLHPLPVLIPNDPSLSGLTVYLQAWTHPAGQSAEGTLTNRPVLTIL